MLNVSIEQLNILGFTEEYRQLTMMLLSIVLTFFIMNKLIQYAFRKQLFILLTYIVSSIILLFIVMLLDDLSIVKRMLQALIIFGFILFLYSSMQAIRQMVYAKKNR